MFGAPYPGLYPSFGGGLDSAVSSGVVAGAMMRNQRAMRDLYIACMLDPGYQLERRFP